IFLPLGGVTLEIVPAFWMVMLGILYGGRWHNGDPPAWPSGEARPWPSQAEMREARQGRAGQPAVASAGADGGASDVAPAPTPARGGSSRRRPRKRGPRRVGAVRPSRG